MSTSARALMALLGRYGKPEQEFSVPFQLGTMKSPTSIKTDRLVSALVIQWHGRIVIGVAPFTSLTDDSLRNLLQEVRVYGTHAQFGAQTPYRLLAKEQSDLNRIYGITYAPRDVTLKGGAATAWDGTVGTWDLDIFWTIPLFPLPLALQSAGLYSLKGPDWAGNLFVDIDGGDGTGLGTLGAGTTVTFSSYGSGAGSPTVFVNVVRPLITVDLMNRVSPAIPFISYKSVDSIVTGGSFTLGKIADLNIGKRMVSIHTVAGTLQVGVTAGVRAFATPLLDTIITRLLPSIDSKFLTMPYSGLAQQEWDGLLGANRLLAGWKTYNFQRETGNPDAAFASETLTSARRFELDGDVTAAAGQGADVIQSEILGSPQIV